MTTIDECKETGPVTLDYIEGLLKRGSGASADVVRRLVGMIARGDRFRPASTPATRVQRAIDAPIATPSNLGETAEPPEED